MAIKKDMLVEKYIEALESGTIPWEKGWTTTRLHNPITGTTYTGINRIWLTFASYLKGYKDSRWFTFNEISNEKKFHPGEKWHLKKGAEGVEIKKKPIYYNEVEDKWYNSKQYYKKLATLNDVEKEIFKDECKVIGDGKGSYYIFNADEIEGIASEQIIEVDSMTVEKMQTIIENMGVGYEEVMQDKSFYSTELDAVITPPKERFKDEAAYFKTLLHELSHATGHANRLNRDLSGEPGSMSYAKEELRADIGAAFLMADFGLEFDESHVQNHLAYIQSWAEVLKNDKNVLLEAVKDAEMINDYILEMSKERQLTLTQKMEHSALDINKYHVELHGCDEGIDYTVTDNKIILSETLLNSLDVDNYSLEFIFSAGSRAYTTLNVVDEADSKNEPITKPTTNPNVPIKPEDTNNSSLNKLPKTGAIISAGVIVLIGLVALCAGSFLLRKKSINN